MPTPQRVLGKLALLFQQDELIMQLLPYEDLYIATHLPYNMLSKKLKQVTDTSVRRLNCFFPKRRITARSRQMDFSIDRWVDFQNACFFFQSSLVIS